VAPLEVLEEGLGPLVRGVLADVIGRDLHSLLLLLRRHVDGGVDSFGDLVHIERVNLQDASESAIATRELGEDHSCLVCCAKELLDSDELQGWKALTVSESCDQKDIGGGLNSKALLCIEVLLQIANNPEAKLLLYLSHKLVYLELHLTELGLDPLAAHTLDRDHILQEADMLPEGRVVSEELLEGKELVFYAADWMEPVYRRNDVPARPRVRRVCEVFADLSMEGLKGLCLEGRSDVLLLYSYVADSQHYVAAEALNRKEAAFLELVIESQDAAARRVEVASVFEEVESD